jgi:hypothetical protein
LSQASFSAGRVGYLAARSMQDRRPNGQAIDIVAGRGSRDHMGRSRCDTEAIGAALWWPR